MNIYIDLKLQEKRWITSKMGSLYNNYMFTICLPYVHHMFTICSISSLYVH